MRIIGVNKIAFLRHGVRWRFFVSRVPAVAGEIWFVGCGGINGAAIFVIKRIRGRTGVAFVARVPAVSGDGRID